MTHILVALHNSLLKRATLNALFKYCSEMKFRVNVLLLDERDAPSPTLAEFIAKLKQAGLSGSLYRQSGPLDQAVLAHTRHHKGIHLILVDNMKNWRVDALNALTQPIGLLGSVVSS
jgi:hypothetical protein